MEILDLSAASCRADPYPDLARVREAGPLCRVEPFGMIGVTRYDDVVAVLKKPQIFSSAGTAEAFPPLPGAELFTNFPALIGQDPPDHTRVRRLIQKAFTIQEMNAWEPRVARLTRRLVDVALDGQQDFDLIRDLGMPLPVTVISEMLGVDPAHQRDFKRWSDDMVSVRGVQASRDAAWRERRTREIVASCHEFRAYFEDVIARRRNEPGDDLLSAIIQAADNGQIVKADEVLGLTRLMLVAGNETTTNLLGNAMVALLQHPEAWRQLTETPALAAAVVEEALRFDGPVLMVTRRLTQDAEIAGERLAAGTIIFPMVASANRDPRRFPDPDRFDLRRESSGHLAFGLGVHLCVGAPLARMETRLALEALATDFADVTLTDAAPQWLDSLFLRGHKSLPLARRSPGRATGAARRASEASV